MEKGMIQLYTGDGKGKTTAAVGLALRALGSGLRVLFVQFMKGLPSGEIDMLARCGGGKIEIVREWDESFVVGEPSALQVKMANEAWERMERALMHRSPDLLVLDEVVVAVGLGLLEEERLLAFLHERPESTEVVMTGRGATPGMLQISDLVTQMRKIKHYYDRGVTARRGIEY